METTIDAAGRLVVPKAIREQAGLQPGMRLNIAVRDGRVEIEPTPRKVEVVKKGQVYVAVPTEEGKKLSSEEVSNTIQAIRER